MLFLLHGYWLNFFRIEKEKEYWNEMIVRGIQQYYILLAEPFELQLRQIIYKSPIEYVVYDEISS